MRGSAVGEFVGAWRGLLPALAEVLGRSAVLAAAVMSATLAVSWLVLRQRPAARHFVLLVGLSLAAFSPGWLVVAGQVPATARRPVAGATGDDMRFHNVSSSPAATPGRPAAGIITAEGAARTGERVPVGLSMIIVGAWLAGVMVAGGRLARGLWRARQISRRARPLGDGLWLSTEIPHAAVLGIRRPRVLLHPRLLEAPASTLDQVVAHERAHARRRDPLWGMCERALAALAWFHPLLPFMRRELARSREEACDDAVLSRHAGADYARTLLALAAAPVVPSDAHLVGVLRPGAALERRIRRALAGVRPSRSRSGFHLLIPAVALVALMVPLARSLAVPLPVPRSLSATPAVSAGTVSAPMNNAWSERSPSSEELALIGRAGPGVRASFVLRELSPAGGPALREVVLDPVLADERFTPASTFKMIIALQALETGVAADESFLLRWTGRRESVPEANADHTLASAMRTSATWYFQELLRRLPATETGRLLMHTGYGNAVSEGDPLRYWIDGRLAISAREQVDYLARLHSGQLPFAERTREVLGRITLLDERQGVRLHGKTGTAVGRPWGTLAWLVGHVENRGRRYVYALLLRPSSALDGKGAADPSAGLRASRMAILRGLLVGFGALPGGWTQ